VRNDLEEQENILKQLRERQGRNENVREKELLLAIDKAERERMIELIEEAYKEYPDVYQFVSYKVALEKEIKSSPRNAIKVLRGTAFPNRALAVLSLYARNGDPQRSYFGKLSADGFARARGS